MTKFYNPKKRRLAYSNSSYLLKLSIAFSAALLFLTVVIFDANETTTWSVTSGPWVSVRALLQSFSSSQLTPEQASYRSKPCPRTFWHLMNTPPYGRGRKPQLKGDGDDVILISGRFGRDDNAALAFDVERKAIPCLSRSESFELNNMYLYGPTFPQFILQDSRYTRHMQFLGDANDASVRGGGYWFWKPPLLQHHLSMVDDGSFVVYADMDLQDTLSWTPNLLEEIDARGADLALIEYQIAGWKDYHYTKRDIYSYYGVDEVYDKDVGQMYAGGYLVVRKNPATLKFIDDWANAAANYHLISDEESVLPNHEGYRESRHDQSLLSVLIKHVYKESEKKKFEDTNLGDWAVQTFAISQSEVGVKMTPGDSLSLYSSSLDQEEEASDTHEGENVQQVASSDDPHLLTSNEGMVNIALNQPVYASTSCYGAIPAHLTDRDVSTVHKVCREGRSWVVVDLLSDERQKLLLVQQQGAINNNQVVSPSSSHMNAVIHIQRDPCCTHRLRNFDVDLLDQSGTHILQTKSYAGRAADGNQISFDFHHEERDGDAQQPGLMGLAGGPRFVRIRWYALKDDWFRLAEVEVNVDASSLSAL